MLELTRDFFRGTSGDGWVAAALVVMGRVSIWTEVPVPTVIRLSVVLSAEEERRMEGDREGERGERVISFTLYCTYTTDTKLKGKPLYLITA